MFTSPLCQRTIFLKSKTIPDCFIESRQYAVDDVTSEPHELTLTRAFTTSSATESNVKVGGLNGLSWCIVKAILFPFSPQFFTENEKRA